MKKLFACLLVVSTSCAPDITVDPDETASDPIVEFDPSKSIVPFPNNLLIDRTTGKVNLPASCNESPSAKLLREQILNKLDGFGTFETPMSVTLTAPIDVTSVTTDNVLLYKIATATGPVDPAAATAIPVVVLPGSSVRYGTQTKNADGTVTCTEPGLVDSMTIIPRVPLEQKSTYVVALKTGLKGTPTGGIAQDYVASFTWSLVRQAENPVTVDYKNTPTDQSDDVIVSDRTPLDPTTPAGLASLLGVDLLWNAHAPVLAFLEAKSHVRKEVLLAWSFKTQTTTDGLDPLVAGSPTTMLNDVAVTGPNDQATAPVSLTVIAGLPTSRGALPFSACVNGAGVNAPPEANDVQCFLKMTLGGGTSCATAQACAVVFATGTATCALVGCANIGDVMTGRIRSPQFQSNLPNAIDAAAPIPGPWADPIKPAKVEDEQLQALLVIPTGTVPAAGWPTVVFQHGLGLANTTLFAAGGQFARDPDAGGAGTGFASIAIDAVAHGGRRVKISNTGDCATAPLPSKCYASFLSADLGSTRDNIRQTVIDQLQVFASIKKCSGGATACGTFEVDPTHITYVGMALGGIVGSITVGLQADVKASVLNVPGVGWADIFENTDTLDIRCLLVDGLIDAGTLMGAKRDTMGTATETDDTGLCIGMEWKTQPGFRQFAAIGRWVLDPADPANFASRLAPKKLMLQQVVGDTVIPNVATRNEGALLGLTAAAASPSTSTTAPMASTAVTTNPTSSKWIQYTNLAPDLGNSFPGNTFSHASLLRPAPSVNATSPADICSSTTPQFCDGVLGTIKVVIDAVTFLQINK